MHIVSPSRWLAQEAHKSVLFRELEISVIPYALDIETFQPRDKIAARVALGLAPDATIILFVAADVSNRRKGLDLLLSAIKSMDDSKAIQLLTVGGGKCVLPIELPHWHIGEVNSDRILRHLQRSRCFCHPIPSGHIWADCARGSGMWHPRSWLPSWRDARHCKAPHYRTTRRA